MKLICNNGRKCCIFAFLHFCIFDEFQNLLEFFVPLPSELIITGDFNIHTDSDLTTPNKFSCILDNFHLKQHIHFPTHDDGQHS